eukprot:gnl/TRDRNA2_/TRDRNA2_156610_c0_seq1.p1 gnl/TRDRNA2_/TRDRNA2_156610_c0~~gnl/TRDRNA2_/TRDRNA2_156610_c0_seq1.p1  ORF type:complete len:346 (+),score=79.92 gnl/TRDRNA2_/TRDRNA2_156610_c0_seq1:29-1066(+)
MLVHPIADVSEEAALGSISGEQQRAPRVAKRKLDAPPLTAAPPRRRQGNARLQSCDGDDVLLLPPCVRNARRKQRGHWANPSSGWRPCTSAGVPAFAPSAAQTEFFDPDTVALVPASSALEPSSPMKLLSLDSVASDDDDLDNFDVDKEMLSKEESEAKRDIWNEVNKDLLEFWAISKKRKEIIAEQKAEKKAERRCQQERLHAARLARHVRETCMRDATHKASRRGCDRKALDDTSSVAQSEKETSASSGDDEEDEEAARLRYASVSAPSVCVPRPLVAESAESAEVSEIAAAMVEANERVAARRAAIAAQAEHVQAVKAERKRQKQNAKIKKAADAILNELLE